ARVAVIFNPDTSPQSKLFVPVVKASASSFAVEVIVIPIHAIADFEPTIASFSRHPNSGLIFPSDQSTSSHTDPFEYGLSAKWLELLKEVAPSVTRAAVLRDPALAAGPAQFAAIQSIAPSLGVEVSPVNVREVAEIERAVATFARSANSGLI